MQTALRLLEDMMSRGYRPDDIVLNHLLVGCSYTLSTVVKLYGKCGKVEEAFKLVNTMEEVYNIKPSVIIFTCLMSGCIRNHKFIETCEVFKLMEEKNIIPD